MRARIEEKNNCARPDHRHTQYDAGKKSKQRRRSHFDFRRNGLRFGAHDLLELTGVDHNVWVAGCQLNHQKQKAGGGKNESGDGETAAGVQLRALADLHERDDRKNKTEDIERKPAATTNECHR